MGRLDDIIERNKKALKAEPFGLLRHLPTSKPASSEDPTPAPPPRMFESVVSPRKSTMPWWKVVPFMLLIGLIVGWQACEGVKADQRDLERRIEHDREH